MFIYNYIQIKEILWRAWYSINLKYTVFINTSKTKTINYGKLLLWTALYLLLKASLLLCISHHNGPSTHFSNLSLTYTYIQLIAIAWISFCTYFLTDRNPDQIFCVDKSIFDIHKTSSPEFIYLHIYNRI